MAQSGFTPISLYYTTTASAAPTAGNLVAGELAINTNDGVLYYKDSSGVVQSIASKASNSGSFTNLAYTGTLTGGTGVVNLGSGQFYKDASGNVGIGTSSPGVKLAVNGAIAALAGNFVYYQNTATNSNFSLQNVGSTGTSALAFASNGTERMRIDSSGNVGVGTTSPFGKVDAVGNSYGAFTARATATGANQTVLALSVVDNTYVNFANAVYYAQSHDWRINGTAVGMNIIPAGNLLLGTTTYYGASAHIVTNTSTSVYGMAICDTASTTGGINFLNSSGTQVGAIFINGASVTYATTSDYRLKENVAPMAGALEIVAKLKPVTYTWKSNGLKCQGFIAHELQEIVPECVSGEKDAMEFVEDLDETGKIIGKKEIPKYQGIDTSFLIATLVSAIQEQQAMIEELKAKVAALEAA